jgi:O-antigen ligase
MFFTGRWINPSLFQACLFLLGTAWAAAFVFRPFRLHTSLVLIPLSAAVAWGLFQLATGRTVNRWDTWMAVLVWSGNLLAYFLSIQVNASTRIRRRFLDTLLYFAFVLSIVSVVQYFGWNGKIFWLYPTYDTAVLGPFVSRDQYAAFMEMMLPLALVKALAGGPKAWRFAVMGAALYATVIAGASRAGALLVTAEVMVIPVVAWWKGSTDNLRASAARMWLFIFLFVSVVGWAVLWDRFQDPEPFKGRQAILHDTLAMVRAQPYFGVGLGNFQTAYPAYASVDFGSVVNHAHDDWMEWAADGGIPFSLLLVAVAVWTIPKAFRTLWGIGLIAVLAHSMVDYPLQKPVLDLWFFALLGAMTAEIAHRRKPEAPDP